MLPLLPGRSYLFSGAAAGLEAILGEFGRFDQLIIDAVDSDVKELRTTMATLQLAAAVRRLFLVKNADSLSEIMQNTLLKLLEEPPSTLVIILQTNQPNRLIPTVQSRLHQLGGNNITTPLATSLFNEIPRGSTTGSLQEKFENPRFSNKWEKFVEDTPPCLPRGVSLTDGPKIIFERLVKLTREDLVVALAGEMRYQRQTLLATSDHLAGVRVELLDLAVKKLRANTNQKLTLDWLLLHWRKE